MKFLEGSSVGRSVIEPELLDAEESKVPSVMGKFLTVLFVCGLFVVTMVLGVADVFAETTGAQAVEVTPIVDFSSVFTSIATVVSVVVVGAVGLSLSIWVVRFVLGVIKGMSRG